MKKLPIGKISTLAFVLIFTFNFIWEISQMFLYAPHSETLSDFVVVHVKATLGDVIIFFIIYAAGALAFRKRAWFLKKKITSFMFSALCGFAIAVIVEKYALATGRWAYDDLMPILPIFKVGLSPILQLVLLPPIIIALIMKWHKKSDPR